MIIRNQIKSSGASLVAQMVKNLPAMRETWVLSLGWEDPLEATHSSILAWRIPRNRGAWQATVHGVTKSWTRLKRLSTAHDYYVKGFNGINGQHVRTDGPCKLRGGNPKKGTIGCARTLV